MSSFLVSNETIDNILSQVNSRANYCYSIEDLSRMGRKLLKMNCLALKYRYNDKLDPKNWNNYSFTKCFIDKCQALKSLRCLLYQCYEGKVPNTQYFKDWEESSYLLCLDIVSDLPQYIKANWG